MTASSMAHNVGKHPSAKEERKVFYTWIYSRSMSPELQHGVSLSLLPFFLISFFFLFPFTAEKAAHWEETTREDKHLFGSAQGNCDRSVQTWREYFPHVARPLSISKQWSLNQVNLKAAHLSTAIQTGKGWYPRDDSETPAEHPE